MSRRLAAAAAALACVLALTACGGASATAEDPASPQLETLDTGADGLIAVEHERRGRRLRDDLAELQEQPAGLVVQ